MAVVNSTVNYREEHLSPIDDISRQCENIQRTVAEQKHLGTWSSQIERWEKVSIEKIRDAAKKAQSEAHRLSKRLTQLSISLNNVSGDVRLKRTNKKYSNQDIQRWYKILEDCQYELDELATTQLTHDDTTPIRLIKFDQIDDPKNEHKLSRPQTANRSRSTPTKKIQNQISPRQKHSNRSTLEPVNYVVPVSLSQPSAYQSEIFGLYTSSPSNIQQLFDMLMTIPPADKNTFMHGECEQETSQMEGFLATIFDFKNISRQYLVEGVKAFRIGKPVSTMHPNKIIRFPAKNSQHYFDMTVKEIIDWQQSYVVYADKNEAGINREFLERALQGRSMSGEEAFRMKFVVRVSKCPIFMEFDGKIIPRTPNDDWPHRINLVSATGINFAGRIHDVNDITTYVTNWNDIYDADSKTGLPRVYEGRDFQRRNNSPVGELKKDLVLDDLIQMARLRLRACDRERIEVVVETGIGLGIFAGEYIGIDDQIRQLSARAIRIVLEEDGSGYKNIRAVVFALPMFNTYRQDTHKKQNYYSFVNEFYRTNYSGPIPVLIADQDMHRLTVAIARSGFNVSELNPADSHGVFGEYWQNRGPGIEEKIALTTGGLLVQHHLINPHVLDANRYVLIQL